MFITDEQISKEAISSKDKKFISIEDYQNFEKGVRFAETIFEEKIISIVKYAFSERNSNKSMEEISKEILQNDVLQG
jgi:hypothetical protein